MILELDVRQLPPREKHPTIFSKFDNLGNGEAIIILNDHDPKPLYYQMLADRGNCFEWEYLKEGPDEWVVKIIKREKTIGEIAASDLRKAKIFMKYGIDFCCGGKKSLKEACDEIGVDYYKLNEELKRSNKGDPELDFNSMPLYELTQYIVNKHHQYIKQNQDILVELTEKVKERHSDKHPELKEVYHSFMSLINELHKHLMKEENILFPYIESLSSGKSVSTPFGTLENPIRVMFYEHDVAGDLIKKIREHSNQYQIPEDACGSYSTLYQLLKEFDEDLMLHIHLENNILFPRSIELENQLKNSK